MILEEFIREHFGTLARAKAAIKESHSLLPEGAWTNDGLYWISPKGKVILVNTVDNESSMGHEEYANTKWNISLEEALQKGYIRLQAISPQYLFVDHAQRNVRSVQIPALTGFFFNQQMAKIPYNEMAIERAGDMRTFKRDQNEHALQFTINGELPEDHEEATPGNIPIPGLYEKKPVPPKDLRPTHPAKWRQAGLDAGIWPPPYDYGEHQQATDYSFTKWIEERKKKE